jgi:hypothetical protein
VDNNTDSTDTDPIVQTQTIVQDTERGIVDVELYGWFINEDDESEVLFDFFVYNYGSVEAKNIKIKCVFLDSNYEPLTSSVYNFGNIASNSYVYDESTAHYNFDMDSYDAEYSAVCFIQSCENCEILNERIPQIMEELKQYK